MLNEIANEQFSCTITPLSGATPGSPQYTLTLSTKNKLNNFKILHTTLSWIMAGCTQTVYSLDNGGGNMSPTGVSVKCEGGALPMRKGDIGSCTGLLRSGISTLACSCQFEITDAGQTSVKGG